LDERFILGRKSMKALLSLGVVIGAYILFSYGCSEKKVPPKDVIGDEEYRVMSAVLKDFETMSDTGWLTDDYVIINKGTDRRDSARSRKAEEARKNSLNRRFGRLALYVDKDKEHSGEFYDTLIMRFGKKAYWVLRDSINGKIAYDSLHRKYGDLTYYLVLSDRTSGKIADSFVIRAKEFKGLITPELLQSYNDNNREQQKLKREHFGDSLVVDLVSRGDVDTTLATRDWWPAFYKRYPLSDGSFGVSRVGFNSDTTIALISVIAVSGRRSGVGWYSLLQKKEGKWEEISAYSYLSI
jgi:hypothetical protein